MINLDDMNIEELSVAMDTFIELHRYASLKKLAIQDRLGGKIAFAMRLEGEMERVYTRLPEDYKW